MNSQVRRAKLRLSSPLHLIASVAGRLTALILAVACLVLTPLALHAQNTTGSVFGNARDASGASVIGATVTLADPEHSFTRTVKSNDKGEFLFNAVPVGTYSITVTAATFASYVDAGITVDANANVKIVADLRVGNASDTVTVANETGSSLDTRSATLGTLIDNKLVEDLPIDGRNVTALAALLPGVTGVNAPTSFTAERSGPTFNASGSRNTQNLFLFDGAIWNNLYYNTGLNYPPPNALAEISVLLNNYKAEYGRNAGSIFSVLSKSGGNQFHGSAWDYIQNRYFNAADYFTHLNPKQVQNQFGATIGGPIIRDKLFFEAAAQDLRAALAATGQAPTQTLPERGLLADGVTPRPCVSAVFAGMNCASFANDLSGTSALKNPLSTGAATQINTPYNEAGHPGNSPCYNVLNNPAIAATGTLPNNEIPTICFNAVNTALVNKYVPVPTNLIGTTLYAITSSPAPTNDQNYLLRLDYNLNSKHTIDARYNLLHSNSQRSPGINSSGQGVATFGVDAGKAISNFGNIGDTWVLSPNALNVFRIAYKRYAGRVYPLDPTTLQQLGSTFPSATTPTLPQINYNRYSLGANSQGYSSNVNQNIEVDDSLSYTQGNHSIKVGVTFLGLEYFNVTQFPNVIQYSTTFTGVNIADAALGLVNTVEVQNQSILHGRQHDIYVYAQDDWRATPRLTLNLGLRYELPFQWYNPKGQSSTFIPGYQSTIYPQAPPGLAFAGDPGVQKSLIPTDFNGFEPRVGFAYDVFGTGKTAIRGGFGMFFDAINANVVGTGQPYTARFNYTASQISGGLTDPLLGLGAPPADFNGHNPTFVGPFSEFFPDKNFRTPYIFAANFGFQQHVPHGGVLEANYVGKWARKLTVPFDLNPALVTPGIAATTSNYNDRVRYKGYNNGGQGLVDFASLGSSSYNALQVQYTQRATKTLTLLSSYTYSQSLDTLTNGQSNNNAIPNVLNIDSERARSDYNVKHNFTMGWSYRLPIVRQGYFIERQVLNGWTFSGTYNARTGRPTNLTINNDTALTNEPNQRPQLLPGANPLLPSNRHRTDKAAEWFNINAFTYATQGTYSSLPRNFITGPGYILTNFTVGREFPLSAIHEGSRFQFRAEALNVFNTPNLNNPQAIFSCSTPTANLPGAPLAPCAAFNNNNFGQIVSTYGNNANTQTNGRKMQFSLTLYY